MKCKCGNDLSHFLSARSECPDCEWERRERESRPPGWMVALAVVGLLLMILLPIAWTVLKVWAVVKWVMM